MADPILPSEGNVTDITPGSPFSQTSSVTEFVATAAKGEKGDTGPTGPEGPQGPEGPAGPEGPGIETITYNDDGTLTITYGDGSQITTGDLKGEMGNPGATGATGPQGPAGQDGQKGDKGDTGPQGPQGPTGPQGQQGEKGDKGDKGDTGSTGPAGPAGSQGAMGIGITDVTANADKTVTITYGADADTVTTVDLEGPAGAMGAQGNPGPKGDPGPTGPQGPTGPKGDKGDKGDTGPAGPAGTEAYTFSTGLTNTDDTITVTNPFTAADETKLDSIEIKNVQFETITQSDGEQHHKLTIDPINGDAFEYPFRTHEFDAIPTGGPIDNNSGTITINANHITQEYMAPNSVGLTELAIAEDTLPSAWLDHHAITINGTTVNLGGSINVAGGGGGGSVQEWASGTAYSAGDLVSYNGHLYRVIEDIGNSTTTPNLDTEHFLVVTHDALAHLTIRDDHSHVFSEVQDLEIDQSTGLEIVSYEQDGDTRYRLQEYVAPTQFSAHITGTPSDSSVFDTQGNFSLTAARVHSNTTFNNIVSSWEYEAPGGSFVNLDSTENPISLTGTSYDGEGTHRFRTFVNGDDSDGFERQVTAGPVSFDRYVPAVWTTTGSTAPAGTLAGLNSMDDHRNAGSITVTGTIGDKVYLAIAENVTPTVTSQGFSIAVTAVNDTAYTIADVNGDDHSIYYWELGGVLNTTSQTIVVTL